MTMNKVRVSSQSGSSCSVMVATPDKADNLLESLGEHAMTLGDTVDEDILTGLVTDISELWIPGYGGMSKKEARMAKKKFAEDEAARNEHIGVVDDLRRDGSKDAERMYDSKTKGEKVGENNDVLDVDSLDSFPSLPTTGSQKSADDVEKENKEKNTWGRRSHSQYFCLELDARISASGGLLATLLDLLRSG